MGSRRSEHGHVHSHLGGECPHKCVYCYVARSGFGRPERYTGPIRLIDSEFKVNYGSGRTIFIEHMNDLFAYVVPSVWISRILDHCRRFPENEYIFQTKNPGRISSFLAWFPPKFIVGTTIETNKDLDSSITKAPQPKDRLNRLAWLQSNDVRVFITIEPIMDFDPETLAGWIIGIHPEFVTIGADSKGCGLPEPKGEKVLKFIDLLNEAGVKIRKKTNLERLIGK